MEQELKTEKEIIVKNAQGDADTRATIVHQNNINYIPKVSVIIPCYNAEKYLKECLDSVVNQTLKEIEIICVDDGSTDSTLEILKEYTQKDNRFTILTQENLHAGVARNAGLAVARGEYLSFLDSDDFFELDMLEKMQFKLDENKAEIAASGFYRYDSETNKDIQISKISEKYIVGLFSPQEFKQDLFQISTPAAWSKMYKRDFLINKEIRFESLKSTNDLTFTDVAFCLANKIVTMNEPFVHYRINSNCNISANRGDKTENFIEAIKKVKTILSQRKKFNTFKDTYYKQFVASAIWELGFCSDLNYYKKIQNKVGSLLPENYKKMFFESTEKRISIIVCVYNDDKYINEALESLLKQTYENIEIICVNDGSTDNSLKILEEYAQKDERIKIINQKNQGLACSRNNALKIASGKYVVFVDSDDYIVENACEVLFEKAEKFNLDMLSYGGVNFDNDTLKQSSNPYYEFRYLPDGFNIDCFSYKDCKSFISKMAVSSCLTMYKRSLIEQKNILFPAGVCFEDNLFFCKALTQALRCGIVKDALYFRRVHSASITQNWAKHHNDYVHVADLVLKYLKSIGVDKKIFESYKDSYITGILDRYNEFETKYQKKCYKKVFEFIKKYNSKLIYKLNRHYGLMNFIFSLRDDSRGTHRVLTILGLKLKIKRKYLEKIFSVKNRESNNHTWYKVIKILGLKFSFKNKALTLRKNIEFQRNALEQQGNELEKQRNEIEKQGNEIEKQNKKICDIKSKTEALFARLVQFDLRSKFEFERCKCFAHEMYKLNLQEKYKKLISNLDNTSIALISGILSRVTKVANFEGSNIDVYTEDEKKQIEKIKKEFSLSIFKISEECYAYKKYLLPINHFESSVFYYKHDIDNLMDLDKIRNKPIIDVGAFIGDSAIVMQDYTDKKVYSFEPTNENYNLMLKTIGLNESDKIVPVKCALGSKDEELEIYMQGSGSSVNRVIFENPEKEKIQVTTLDKYVSENNIEVGLIKVDIEGFEQEFLKGAINTIKEQKPTLLISIYHNASDFFDIKPMIESWNLGYKFKIVKPIDGSIRGEILLIAEQE